VGFAEPLVFDMALCAGSRRGPTCNDDRDDDRSWDCGDSERSSTQGQAGIHEARATTDAGSRA
jgi:hypothetical protein